MGVKVRGVDAQTSLERVSRALTDMQNMIDALDLETKTLQQSWDGEAQRAFSTAMAQAHAALARLRGLATLATGHASTTIDDFAAFDRRRAGVWAL